MAQMDREDRSITPPTHAAVDGPYDGQEAEHIYIEDVFADADDQPRTVSSQARIRNRIRGVVTELTFYEEGFLGIREAAPKKILKDHTLELRFVDPDPVMHRHVARNCFLSSASTALAAIGAYFALPLTSYAGYSFAATTVLTTAAAVAFMLTLYRSHLTVQFVTTSGRAEVLRLVGNVGCIRRVRRATRAIRSAISRAGDESGVHDVRYLRAEMQAHYRLLEKGVISQEECSDGTAQILAKFG